MDLELSPQDIAFRDEVRQFIADHLPQDIRDKMRLGQHLVKDDYVRWQKTLHQRGWMGVGWPTEHGGPDWSPVQRYIFEEETGLGDCPRIIPFGLRMVGPVIIAFGTDEQKLRHLPKILSSDVWWCQGYSEPGAGSDLASLKTRAVRDNGHYVVNGQKTWTTLAQYADWIFCLVRTDESAKKQEGISFLLIDMKTPGITVKPIVTLDGGREVNEVFFDDVRVPVENLVGPENEGWTVAKFLLGHERTNIAEVGRSKNQLARIKEIAAAEMQNGAPLIEDPRFREKIADVEINLMALDMTLLRIVSAESAGRAPGPEASLLKIRATEVQQA
ncbi:MAG: acyl-CoA dehydrogenase family protein, partial [Bauldia litoralis]